MAVHGDRQELSNGPLEQVLEGEAVPRADLGRGVARSLDLEDLGESAS
jgi:hypothetical protein